MTPVTSKRSKPRLAEAADPNRTGPMSCVSALCVRPMMAIVLLFFHAASCSVIGQNEPSPKIHAFTGASVILPCSVPVRDDLPTVEWSKEGLEPNVVFLYRDGCETFEMKNTNFQYRTNLIMNELTNGNFSLMITNVQLTDSGKYQCTLIQRKNRKVINTFQLIVGAVSEPQISADAAHSAVTVECRANCWFPEPGLTFFDDKGNIVSAEDPKRHQEPGGCFTVTRRATLPTASNRVTCRVHEPLMNTTKYTEPYNIPGDCTRACIITGIIVFLTTILATGAFSFFYKNYVGTTKADLSTTSGGAGVQENLANSNQNANAEQMRRLEELNNDKDKKIEELNKKLKQARKTLEQPMTSDSPSTSSPDMHPGSYDNNTEPLGSLSINVIKPENLPRKDRQPLSLRPHAGVDPPTSRSSSRHSNAELTLEKMSRTRTKSQSGPCGDIVRSPRRNTFSVSSSYASYNRYSALIQLSEDSEDLLQDQQK